ncbi:N-acetylglucosamine-6-phosphate deacetylase [Clostridium algidicarnis]|uniref:N-acetylglucosamine-6-phosphate deacetylase n=2 Tax=Clostridium algidicarnis TaxID=37659 RepID=A0A2S6FZE9_9CLOT|nr:N-acetylglucosamine-6-phosphate deacetylase [Clostridium algidicarnis]MBB6630984.1 N-acetylglucosamine-6-phosphate deacetylase [Clostridium algidicarnis]MBU3194201.1 N-acetylglucosamine-6-phosphate deacetylase [Clostridium algidicarnis]MBU3218942.1 N-acetylglucosamine-6-phosphate deacetylase [Clostridium algidicarnis]MBU3229085.1 N-acetylglucosamine-6-phosphate deacetylase [Clostridium algidicarnis]MBU3251894.1 N-acetylglucosamine-6-phosphate deacetylase [Clostridium algidicarnis]
MLIKNCKIIYEDRIEEGSVLLHNGKITSINPENTDEKDVIDAEGLYLSPGFIDVHIHGAGGRDTMDGSYESLNIISKTIAKYGTTSFLPTTMTCSISDIKKALETIKEAKLKGTDGANILGAHLEGPFISPKAIGAQNPDFVENPFLQTFLDIVGDNIDTVVSVTIAPEIEGACELIAYLRDNNITASMGHTKATYEEAMTGIQCGISHSTHLYNAMTGLHHRNPGTVGAIFDSSITTETISDGIHISYPSLRVAYKQKGLNKVLLVTDAMMACSMPDGIYSLGGQKVIVENGAARLKSGSLAGSILTLDKAVRNVYNNTDYPLNEIVNMATVNPARLCKVDTFKGSVKEGFDADLLLFDDGINIKKVIINGKIIL